MLSEPSNTSLLNVGSQSDNEAICSHWMIKEKKYSLTLVNDEEADFIQDHSNRDKDHYSGILQSGRETGLNLNTVWASGTSLPRNSVGSVH